MKLPRAANLAIYALVVVLSLFALWLVFNVPPDMLDSRSVYQGF